jgi:hypothetical protein
MLLTLAFSDQSITEPSRLSKKSINRLLAAVPSERYGPGAGCVELRWRENTTVC